MGAFLSVPTKSDECATTEFFGPRFAALPEELRDKIITDAVKSEEDINLRDLDKTLDALTAPFKNVPSLRDRARQLALQTNTFFLVAAKTVVRTGGEPTYVWPRTGQELTVCEDVRNLKIRVKIVAQGRDWEKDGIAERFEVSHLNLFLTLSTVFPKLDKLEILVCNHGRRLKTAQYIGGWQLPVREEVDMERRVRMMDLVALFCKVQMPVWNSRRAPPRKTLVFSQRCNKSSLPRKEVEWGNRHSMNAAIREGFETGWAKTEKLHDRCFEWMVELCDWPQVRLTLDAKLQNEHLMLHSRSARSPGNGARSVAL